MPVWRTCCGTMMLMVTVLLTSSQFSIPPQTAGFTWPYTAHHSCSKSMGLTQLYQVLPLHGLGSVCCCGRTSRHRPPPQEDTHNMRKSARSTPHGAVLPRATLQRGHSLMQEERRKVLAAAGVSGRSASMGGSGSPPAGARRQLRRALSNAGGGGKWGKVPLPQAAAASARSESQRVALQAFMKGAHD